MMYFQENFVIRKKCLSITDIRQVPLFSGLNFSSCGTHHGMVIPHIVGMQPDIIFVACN